MDYGNQIVEIRPIISYVQKIALYETKSFFYIIGSNNEQSRFRVLKISRSEPKELVVLDDKKEYRDDEIKRFVSRIDSGFQNRIGENSSSNSSLKVISAFGLIGFIRFLEGYYVILITKRRRVAVIGNHTIYKIEDSSMIYIPNDSVRTFHPEEQKYVKMFQSIDLSSNFYFSYSFDITHTLQYNMVLPTINQLSDKDQVQYCGVRNKPHERFVWNLHLLAPGIQNLHSDWLLYIIHGFIGQSNVSVFGRSIYITLIARRSNKYAGTRFLKRGANLSGDVANEVETEQIVFDAGTNSFNKGEFSSFVQMRGSVPSLWSQDVSKMVPKPSIAIDLSDPFSEIAGAHLNQLLYRYGSPIIILNLVKKREHKKHESILSEEMLSAVKYLNQFLPPEYHIQYVSFDMARKNKGKLANVMGKLAAIANNAVQKTKIFFSVPQGKSSKNILNRVFILNKNQEIDSDMLSIHPSLSHKNESFNESNNIAEDSMGDSYLYIKENQSLQTGIIRTNCVDCLDRTNTAQFAIGKCALGFQLCALGVLESPKLEFDSDCVRMLEELYEDHGDTLALQYGGSQLVHRIKSYRKTAPWTSQGNDIMQTLSRYYSNTFSDQEKQHTINLFLGLFIPDDNKRAIWELGTDYHLHYKPLIRQKTKLITQWWDENALKTLPYSYFEVSKEFLEMNLRKKENELVDVYYDYYRPFEITLLTNAYAYQISHSARDFMPHFTPEFSPFVVRVRPGKRREESSQKNSSLKNPSLTGQSSTSSTTSSASSSNDSDSDNNESNQLTDSQISKINCNSMSDWYSTVPEVIETKPNYPKRSSISLYKKSAVMNENAKRSKSTTKSISSFFRIPKIELSSKNVPEANVCAYEQYISLCKEGETIINYESLNIYENYVYRRKLSFDVFNINYSQCV